MAKPDTPLWKKLFDTAERTVGSKVNDFARSENFAILAGLVARSRSELTSRSERSSRQVLHLLNLPAASDVNRLLAQIGLLEREVRDLRKQIEDQTRTVRPAEARKKVTSNGVSAQPRVRADQDSS